MESDTIILQDIRESDSWKHLQVRFDENGNLLIEGHDMGEAVEKFFGEGSNEKSLMVNLYDNFSK